MPHNPIQLLVVLGPTASGKTRLAVQLADRLGGEILSADSRQVYKGLNIGAGKDLREYSIHNTNIPYHLIDIATLEQEFSAYHFQKEFYRVYQDCQARQVMPVLVGGTGLYLEAVLRGYAMQPVPENAALRAELSGLSYPALIERLIAVKHQHNTTDILERARLLRAIEIAEYERRHAPEPRPAISTLVLGVHWDRTELRRRIAKRLQERIQQGMIAEVEKLRQQGVSWERLQNLGLEYRWVSNYLLGNVSSQEELFEKLFSAICKFAKRQETWFRRMGRRGVKIYWIEQADLETAWNMVAPALPGIGQKCS
ncbi:tRNA (adenosine(37)-N6)-dimethylallyltransferase MiaA [bacterium]|nr:tRNA (adenosine(37)-N6)-dimethylallyltransferase MiaA [bacterium]